MVSHRIPKFEGTEHSISVINTSGIAISKTSKHKDEAWEFLKYWTGEEMNKYRIETELPALKSVVESENLRENPNCAPFYTALDNCAGYAPASFIADAGPRLTPMYSLHLKVSSIQAV